MTAPQATIFQWCVCGCIVVWLIVCLITILWSHKDKPYDEAEQVARAQWQKTEAQ